MNYVLLLSIVSIVTGIIYFLDLFFWSKKREPGQSSEPMVEFAKTLFPISLTLALLFTLNFALVLVLLSLFTGFIYLIDVLYWSKKRKKGQEPDKIIEYSRSFFSIFLIVLILRSFLIEPFRIPSSSLEPTLLVGDFLAVNKFAYGLRLPVWEKKIIPISNPQTGDIVVFRWPPNPNFDYIKRVIGVPGDKITYRNKILSINGKVMPQTFVEYTIDESSGRAVAKYRENLNGVEHDIYLRPEAFSEDFEVEVPPNQYFMMGDNRDDSQDSRYWGFAADKYLRGKALMVWLSWNKNTFNFRWSRMGRFIH